MVLVDVVRGVGALVGICGALIVAPKALPVLVRIWVRPAWRAVRSHLPGYRQDASVMAKTATATMTAHAAMVAAGSVWYPGAPVAEQIERLRVRTDELDASIQQLRQDTTRDHHELTDKLETVKQELSAELRALRSELQAREGTTVRIDAVGFPVIAASFVLTGMPEAWVRVPWVAGLLLAFAAAFTSAGAVHVLRLRRANIAGMETA